MVGPPGCGKTMLARRLPGILPPLALEEAIEITCVYSAAGLLDGTSLMRQRPFRAPHHTVSGVGLVGGGRIPRPGEVTLAHHGVLFLDEIAEFGRATLDVLRQPLEDGAIVISRANRSSRLPARFTLVGAMNPCPCGQLGRSDRPCACTPAMVAAYRARLSGPLFDRFDMQVELTPLSVKELREGNTGEPSESVAARVAAARERQAGCRTNLVSLDDGGHKILTLAVGRLALSARAHDGILRVARTIADLEGTEAIGAAHVAEAVQYRALDRGQIFTS
jgi:magnesium chelatase family protein